jgi:hypothetical protein
VPLEVQAHLEVRPGLALAKCGQLQPALAWLRPALAWLRPTVVRPSLVVVRPDLARCVRPYTIALVHPSMIHLSIAIPISMYLHVKITTKLVEPH